MASVIESLKEAREYYVKMSEAAATLKQAADQAEQNYQRLNEQMQRTQAVEKRLEGTAAGVDARLNSIAGHFFWSRVFAAVLGGLVSGGMLLYFVTR